MSKGSSINHGEEKYTDNPHIKVRERTNTTVWYEPDLTDRGNEPSSSSQSKSGRESLTLLSSSAVSLADYNPDNDPNLTQYSYSETPGSSQRTQTGNTANSKSDSVELVEAPSGPPSSDNTSFATPLRNIPPTDSNSEKEISVSDNDLGVRLRPGKHTPSNLPESHSRSESDDIGVKQKAEISSRGLTPTPSNSSGKKWQEIEEERQASRGEANKEGCCIIM